MVAELTVVLFCLWLLYIVVTKNESPGLCILRSEEISRSTFNAMIGLVDRERIDAALYDDFETEKAREVIDQICLLHHF